MTNVGRRATLSFHLCMHGHWQKKRQFSRAIPFKITKGKNGPEKKNNEGRVP